MFLFTSCYPGLKSVSGIESGQDAYKNIAIVSTIDNDVEKACNLFHDAISKKLENRAKVFFEHTVTGKENNLELNSSSNYENVKVKLKEENPDLIITIVPTYKLYKDGFLNQVDYEVIGLDMNKEIEVWKARFSLHRVLFSGPHKSAEKVAEQLYQKMLKDGLI